MKIACQPSFFVIYSVNGFFESTSCMTLFKGKVSVYEKEEHGKDHIDILFKDHWHHDAFGRRWRAQLLSDNALSETD